MQFAVRSHVVREEMADVKEAAGLAGPCEFVGELSCRSYLFVVWWGSIESNANALAMVSSWSPPYLYFVMQNAFWGEVQMIFAWQLFSVLLRLDFFKLQEHSAYSSFCSMQLLKSHQVCWE